MNSTNSLAFYANKFQWTEYLVFSAVLAASFGIFIFYGFFSKRNRTSEEFLMGGRSMSIFPVAMSLLCTFVSAVTLLGNPVEVYFYGTQYLFVIFAYMITAFLLIYVYVPVYFDLQLTSAYEYFEWRFSRKVRILCSVFAMSHLIFYMPIAVFGPSLALDQMTGMNYKVSSAIIFIVCILYTSIGGLKTVLWTDALQALVMLAALIMIIVFGVSELGGVNFVWEKASSAGRISFWNFDPDPRTRHTVWTAVVGGTLQSLPIFAATQAQIQRYNSVRTLSQSRKALVFNMIGQALVQFMCAAIGLLIYAAYYDCDPVEAKIVQSPDQLTPLFVMQILGKYNGLPGLLLAGLTCGSLSTVSSALNSLTAIITEDYVKKWKPKLTEEQLGKLSKWISAGTGFLAFGLIFVIDAVNDKLPILPLSTLMHGSLLGPILGAFTIGMVFPWAYDLGTFCGIILSVVLTGFIGLGSIISSNLGVLPDQKLALSIDGCYTDGYRVNSSAYSYASIAAAKEGCPFDCQSSCWKEDHSDDSFFLKAFSVSYLWQPGIGAVTTFMFGLVFSFIVSTFNNRSHGNDNTVKKVNIKLLSKPCVRFWMFLFGKQKMNAWIEFEEFDYGGRKEKSELRHQQQQQIITNGHKHNNGHISMDGSREGTFKQFEEL